MVKSRFGGRCRPAIWKRSKPRLLVVSDTLTLSCDPGMQVASCGDDGVRASRTSSACCTWCVRAAACARLVAPSATAEVAAVTSTTAPAIRRFFLCRRMCCVSFAWMVLSSHKDTACARLFPARRRDCDREPSGNNPARMQSEGMWALRVGPCIPLARGAARPACPSSRRTWPRAGRYRSCRHAHEAPIPDEAGSAELAELAALADGSLAPERRAALEARVAAIPELADRLAEQQRAVALARERRCRGRGAACPARAHRAQRRAPRAEAPWRLVAVGVVGASSLAVAVGLAVAVRARRASASAQPSLPPASRPAPAARRP